MSAKLFANPRSADQARAWTCSSGTGQPQPVREADARPPCCATLLDRDVAPSYTRPSTDGRITEVMGNNYVVMAKTMRQAARSKPLPLGNVIATYGETLERLDDLARDKQSATDAADEPMLSATSTRSIRSYSATNQWHP